MTKKPAHVGGVRPSQLLYTYGVGAIVDLPRLSVIVLGLDDWPTNPEFVRPIVEDRLLTAVRYGLPSVNRLLAPPVMAEDGVPADPFEQSSLVGVPVTSFPRWMVCPQCRLLAPLSSGLFKLKPSPYSPERTAYRHETCEKLGSKISRPPEVIPARFLVACENGHLDDFPWVEFVHNQQPCSSPNPLLRLQELSASGEARDMEVRCEACKVRRRLSEAFGIENRKNMPACKGYHPHLRQTDLAGCSQGSMRTIVLGASNTWFPVVLSALAIPVEGGKLAQLIDEKWSSLQAVTAPVILDFLRSTGQLGELAQYSNDAIWQAIDTRRQQDAGQLPLPSDQPDLKTPEWDVLTQFDPQRNGSDFRLVPVPPPPVYASIVRQVMLVERLREVSALVGFTRLEALGELSDPDWNRQVRPSPLSKMPPTWAPAAEVRGEGIFIQFDEAAIQSWLTRPEILAQAEPFFESHVKWRQTRGILPPEGGFPGMRYILLHSFAHALMRQLVLECGYAAASVRERIYSRPPEEEGGPMAGILIYTAAPDSEGTLGGLVSLGRPAVLERHIAQALEAARLCASDPLCAEHPPSRTGRTLHAAACHACLLVPETSCERGNKYLDRSVLVGTVVRNDLSFFD